MGRKAVSKPRRSEKWTLCSQHTSKLVSRDLAAQVSLDSS
jgi:hypothetical protein